MIDLERALVVGGGVAGTAAAIVLRGLGVAVDLVDIDPAWSAHAYGLTLTGPGFRALASLGVLEEVRTRAFIGGGMRVCSVDGDTIAEVPDPPGLGPGMPGVGGIMLPDLHDILKCRVQDAGTRVRPGVGVEGLTAGREGVDVALSDGSRRRYDLVVGADGVRSQVRQLLFPELNPARFAGQYAWRLRVGRDPGIDCRHVFFGGPIKVGLHPVSDGEMCLFALENRSEPVLAGDRQAHEVLSDMLQPFGGAMEGVRAGLGPGAPIVSLPIETMPLPRSWSRGAVVLIGDAVHPITPQLFSGVALCCEDAVVLGEALVSGGALGERLARFSERRFKRCRRIVENSSEIIRRENAGGPVGVVTALVEESLRALTEPF